MYHAAIDPASWDLSNKRHSLLNYMNNNKMVWFNITKLYFTADMRISGTLQVVMYRNQLENLNSMYFEYGFSLALGLPKTQVYRSSYPV